MPKKSFPHCGCFSFNKHGSGWEAYIEQGFTPEQLKKVEEKSGCEVCQVRFYNDEAARCRRCEVIRSFLKCKHRHGKQLGLFD